MMMIIVVEGIKMIKIFLITSLIIASASLIPITIALLRKILLFGRIDLITFTYGIFGWFPNVLLTIFVVICLKIKAKSWISFILAVALIIWSGLMIADFLLNGRF